MTAGHLMSDGGYNLHRIKYIHSSYYCRPCCSLFGFEVRNVSVPRCTERCLPGVARVRSLGLHSPVKAKSVHVLSLDELPTSLNLRARRYSAHYNSNLFVQFFLYRRIKFTV